MGPKMPQELRAPSLSLYSAEDFDADVKAYRADVKNGSLDDARALRNQIAYRVMADIEAGYGKFEMRITSDRAVQATASDATVLGLSAATAVITPGDVTGILAATSTAFQGTWHSYDKNFFREKTTEALIAQMRAARRTKQAQLITALENRDVKSYPLDAVWIDLVDFYYAGTVPSALVDIAASAGSDAQKADATLNAALAQAAKQAISIRAAYQKLAAAINGTDRAERDGAVQSLKQILTQIGYDHGEDLAPAQLLQLLQKAMSDADPDNDPTGAKLKALNAAIAAANLN